MSFPDQVKNYTARVEAALERCLPDPRLPPVRLHTAMRYSVLGGGKRIRPVLAYATAEALGIGLDQADGAATSIELMHAFSLVHDDLPAMDNDDLRRGRPTTHRAFDEATAILAADALQPLAFRILATDPALSRRPEVQLRVLRMLAEACGSEGMTGGQSIDLESEGKRLDVAELEHMYRLKTGCLLRASIMAAVYVANCDTTTEHNFERFADALGLAFQIRDDILDIEGNTAVIGKQAGADQAREKATYPAMFGIDQAKRRADELLKIALHSIAALGPAADMLRWTARYVVMREA